MTLLIYELKKEKDQLINVPEKLIEIYRRVERLMMGNNPSWVTEDVYHFSGIVYLSSRVE